MSSFIRKAVREMDGYTPGEQPSDPDVVKLNTNENPYPPSPRVKDALSKFLPETLRLYPDPLCRRLRMILSKLHKCRSEQIFCANGSDEILALATRAFVEDRGQIGYFEPSYSLYPVLSQIRGVTGVPVVLGKNFTWRMPSKLPCSLFFLANPNAPTSLMFDPSKVRSFCRRFSGVVLLDEAYADFARSHNMHLALELPNVLVMRTLSKAYSMAGLRFGYAVGATPLIEALFKIKDSYNVNRLTQELAAVALKDQACFRKNLRCVLATRRRLAKALERLGFFVHPSDTNFLWVRPPAGVDAASLYNSLRANNILVRYFDAPHTSTHLRITIGTDHQTNRLLAALAAILQEGSP